MVFAGQGSAAPMRARSLTLILVLLFPVAWALPSVPAPFGPDDAGSGRDAPDAPPSPIFVESGRAYEGNLSDTRDVRDVYSFRAQAGDPISIRLAGPQACLALFDPSDALADSRCVVADVQPVATFLVAREGGVWSLAIASNTTPQSYAFSVGVNQAAAQVLPVSLELVPNGGQRVEPTQSAEQGPHTVVAVLDSGINPYHQFFRASALVDAPSTWLPGYPSSAQPLALSLDAPDYATAVAQDRATFDAVPRSVYHADTDTFDEHLYYVPGTRIVGAISFGEDGSTTAPGGTTPILDEVGHGTQVAALALGADASAPDGNVLVVMVEISSLTVGDAFHWVAHQPWIDAVVLSREIAADAPLTPSTPVVDDRANPDWATLAASLSGKPIFVASGNGASDTGTPPDHCVTYTSVFAG